MEQDRGGLAWRVLAPRYISSHATGASRSRRLGGLGGLEGRRYSIRMSNTEQASTCLASVTPISCLVLALASLSLSLILYFVSVHGRPSYP
ncbi:hypothetical protein BDW74DRAFT_148503 [Aspergillus multicolor]|uniref:uncharacterized protein n=1 Tax=Aspergillus multicolor TaxID=41759 RepID=UPI003CCDF7DF